MEMSTPVMALQLPQCTWIRLIKELSSLGGYNASSTTRHFLEAIMTQEMAVHYSWLGRKGKRAFSTLPICDIMYRCVRHTIASAKRCEIEDVAKTWFRHAAEKLKRRTTS
ncbi:hypothetical protein MTO96_040458 [Rhipicephalus appendiculatus]